MKYWTSYDVTVKARRSRVSIASRLFGLLILLLAVVFWPTAVMAADSGVETQRNTAVVFTVLLLFVGSVTGGVLFVSPLGRRFNRPAQAPAATEVMIKTMAVPVSRETDAIVSPALAPIPPADIPAEPSYYLPLPKAQPVGGLIDAPALAPLRPLPLEPLPAAPMPVEPSRASRVYGWPEQDLRGWPLADIRARPMPQSRATETFRLEPQRQPAQPKPSQAQPKKSPWSTSNPVLDGLWNRGGRATS